MKKNNFFLIFPRIHFLDEKESVIIQNDLSNNDDNDIITFDIVRNIVVDNTIVGVITRVDDNKEINVYYQACGSKS